MAKKSGNKSVGNHTDDRNKNQTDRLFSGPMDGFIRRDQEANRPMMEEDEETVVTGTSIPTMEPKDMRKEHTIKLQFHTKTEYSEIRLAEVISEVFTNQALIEALVDGLHCGYSNAQYDASKFSEDMQEAIYEQNQIGWIQLFFGRISRKWQESQY
jgi:hypothetical protein